MKEIPLTQGKVALVDNADYKWLNRWKWSMQRGEYTCYAMRRLPLSDHKRELILMHRIILSAPDGIEVDHKNGNGLDNRRSNLRLCTHGENQRHQRLGRRNTTGFKGVCKQKGIIQKPYRAFIWVSGRNLHLGYYQSAREAARAYDLAAKKYYGGFALTNEMLGLL